MNVTYSQGDGAYNIKNKVVSTQDYRSNFEDPTEEFDQEGTVIDANFGLTTATTNAEFRDTNYANYLNNTYENDNFNHPTIKEKCSKFLQENFDFL